MTSTDDQIKVLSAGRSVFSCVCLALAFAMGGCGSPAGIVFEHTADAPTWPPPPDPVRVRYVGQITSEEDLKPKRDFLTVVGQTLFGKDDNRTMRSPYALCTDNKQRLFVADSTAGVVHVFDLDTRQFQQWTPGGTGKKIVEPFGQPVGIACHPDGRLFVSDSVAGKIYIFDNDGRNIGVINEDKVTRPCGLAIDTQRGYLYVADSAGHRIVVLDLEGQWIKSIGQRGEILGEFNFPTNVALDSEGKLYVSDSLNFRVQVFDTDHNPIRQIGKKGDLPGYFSQPKGIAIDNQGNLLAVDTHFEAAQIFEAQTGDLLMSFGREGHGAGQFWLPAGIHIDAQNQIWIADVYNRRIQLFQILGGNTP